MQKEKELMLARPKTTMGTIREGLARAHPPGTEDTDFADAIYELFREFQNDYQPEWARIDDNERMYHGDHWAGVDNFGSTSEHDPKPATPIVTSTIESIKADLSDDFPEAVILPDEAGSELTAKVLTKVIAQELDVCGWDMEYDSLCQDVLNCGWAPLEVGHDPYLNNGLGGAYIRYIVNKNFMCDPQCASLQDGRAVFKMERKPRDWFEQHYPEHAPYLKDDADLVSAEHDDFGATTTPGTRKYLRLIEAWFRVYDPKTRKHRVHFVLTAGGQILENSCLSKPEGYFAHGLYPFVICRLFRQKGSALGFGITDLFKDANRYSDKLDQILLKNAYLASHPRLLIQKGLADADELRDWANEVIEVDGAPSAVASWQQAQPLPSYIMNYIQLIRDTIKTESGSNEQSRGSTGSGVTAASAITALQEMSTKRSRMEGRAIHYAFKESVRMMVEVIREFDIVPRDIPVTVNGRKLILPFDRRSLSRLIEDGAEVPAEHFITVKTARQTKYTKLMHNELWLQMLQTLGGQVDPVIMIEGLEYEEKETLLDNIRRAQQGGMQALQKQLAQMQQLLQQQAQQLDQHRAALAQSEALLEQQQTNTSQQTASTLAKAM